MSVAVKGLIIKLQAIGKYTNIDCRDHSTNISKKDVFVV
jgi:hypothetical protein